MSLKVAVLAPICWRTPPRHYGPWEQVSSNIAEGLIKQGIEVTLFATGDSLTAGKLEYIAPRSYEEDKNLDPKTWECLHIGHMMEQADSFDIIHNNYDFHSLIFSRVIKTPIVTTIHGFSSPRIIPMYKEYNKNTHYVSISNSDRSPELDYIGTVYNGINIDDFTFNETPEDYLLYFGRIHHDKGTAEAIQIALKSKRKLIISGIIQDENYFKEKILPFIDGENIVFVGPSGPEKRDELLGKAAVLLHPINFNEPFGLSVAEAMLCGTPVIAFNKGSMPELIEHGKSGFLVNNIAEAVDALKEIPQLDRAFCRSWSATKFSCEKMSADYLKIYRKILSYAKNQPSSFLNKRSSGTVATEEE